MSEQNSPTNSETTTALDRPLTLEKVECVKIQLVPGKKDGEPTRVRVSMDMDISPNLIRSIDEMGKSWRVVIHANAYQARLFPDRPITGKEG